ncbi:hypothetical protein NFI95_00085 [Acetobacteraceae bacterium KSS8]|uniref:Serine/threonine protein kinase n=1 Tax=Endosaccharibacter trunci TaxID=2812733 RepID=A0ABT1W266_9PROT|nr:hypothetical protein [Acetobacteraceae bacterium KSS8]
MRAFRIACAGSLLLASWGVASAQTAPAPDKSAVPAQGAISPRTPGGDNAGTTTQNQHRMDATVGGIDRHLLKQEKDRPRLPGQAPSPSQTLPGGTAAPQPH